MTGFRRAYGSNPLHLLGHLALFVVAAWAIGQIFGGGAYINWIAWFVGAALLHDLVLLPSYSAIDRALGTRMRPSTPDEPRRVPVRNHVRAPATIAGILLLVYFPLILGLSSANYLNDTGHKLAGYTRNWLLITAGLFVASAIIYAMRVVKRRPPLEPETDPAEQPAPPASEQPAPPPSEQPAPPPSEQPGD